MTIFVLFFTEFMAMRYAVFGHQEEHEHGHAHSHNHAIASSKSADKPISPYSDHDLGNASPSRNPEQEVIRQSSNAHQPGDDHLGHAREHTHHEDVEAANNQPHSHSGSAGVEDYAAQMTAIFILEFGVIFHSIFIGLTLAVSGPEFSTLYVVIVFHQTFEGLGLGARLAVAPWPKNNKMTPYILALIYAVSTPIAISIGLGVRQTYVPGSQTALVANGVFDSISAGILIYTGLVELMAHEFMFSTTMRKAPIKVPLAAFGVMCLGAGMFFLLCD
jgi:zinc transporter 1/2/3